MQSPVYLFQGSLELLVFEAKSDNCHTMNHFSKSGHGCSTVSHPLPPSGRSSSLHDSKGPAHQGQCRQHDLPHPTAEEQALKEIFISAVDML
jgi:hypothetical protein